MQHHANFLNIGQSVAEIYRFFVILNMAVAAMDYQNVEISTVAPL